MCVKRSQGAKYEKKKQTEQTASICAWVWQRDG